MGVEATGQMVLYVRKKRKQEKTLPQNHIPKIQFFFGYEILGYYEEIRRDSGWNGTMRKFGVIQDGIVLTTDYYATT